MICIKLPNFFEDKKLNALKAKMGIDRTQYGDYQNYEIRELKKILNFKGKEVEDISDIVPLSDHTLSYKNERVILYIRDVPNYREYNSLPKFHVAQCTTLDKMFASNRKKRYVCAQNESGIFYLNIDKGQGFEEYQGRLDVCKNCLEILQWEGYSGSWSRAKKDQCVRDFRIADFFEKYPKSLLSKKGHANIYGPENRYTPDWSRVSREYRQLQNWTCEQCGVQLADHRRLLETHHINGQRNENGHYNLRALCVECHAKQPLHDHMRNQAAVQERIKIVQQIRAAQQESEVPF